MVRMFFPILLFIASACTSSQAITDNDRFKIVISNESNLVANELNISPFAFGVEGPDGIQGIMLSYMSKARLNLDQARKLIIRLAQNIPSRVNNKIASENLNRSPVDLSFFYLAINFFDKDSNFNENEGEISRVDYSRGIISYKISRPGVSRFIPIHSETIEEAYRIVNSQP